ncbi:MAG: hypothetical protein ACI9QD_000441 [Thermoproteota archaeon]|jgi:hypothetical protein
MLKDSIYRFSFRFPLKAIFKLLNKRFKLDSKKFIHHQDTLLKKLIAGYADTLWGKERLLKKGDSYQDFVSKVCISQFEDLAPYLERDRTKFNQNILFKRPIIWEKSSGSSGKAKYIPYCFSILNSFKRMSFIWLADLIAHGPKFSTGKIFFSISPPFYEGDERNHSFEDDSEYLPFVVRLLFKDYFINPKELKNVRDHYDFKIILCSYLISSRDLETLFIWSPSYLISMWQFIQSEKEVILKALEYEEYKGIKLPACDENLENLINDTNLLWPKLKLISCWVDGSAILFLPKLKKMFPHAYFQGKGLLATEAPMTFPLESISGGVPLPKDIFYEFEDTNGEVFRLEALVKGKVYKIIISHLSGIIRYDIGDLVEVSDFYIGMPCLKFLGRSGNFCDLTGEKLNEVTVQEILYKKLSGDQHAFLVPTLSGNTPYYFCIHNNAEGFNKEIEAELMQIYHYEQSRKLGQLDSLKEIIVSNPEKLYFDYYQKKGIMVGDIKYTCLIKDIDAIDLIKEIIKDV